MAAIHHHTCRLHQEGEKWNQSSLCTLYTRDHFSLSILLCCSWLYTQGCVCGGVRGRESEREKRRERDCGQGCFTPIISLSFLHYHWCSHQTSQLNTALVTLYISHPFCKNTILEKKKSVGPWRYRQVHIKKWMTLLWVVMRRVFFLCHVDMEKKRVIMAEWYVLFIHFCWCLFIIQKPGILAPNDVAGTTRGGKCKFTSAMWGGSMENVFINTADSHSVVKWQGTF